MFLLGAEYNGTDRAVYLKFYDDEKIVKIKDRFNHKPYCYTRKEYEKNLDAIMNLSDIYTKEDVELEDLIVDSEDTFVKISAPDPLKIGGNEESIRNKIVTWESDIKYYERYLYDNKFICGLEYDKDLNPIYIDIDYDEVYKRLGSVDEKYKEYIDYWVKLLNQPIPNLTRMAVDIEVEFDGVNVPSISNPDKKIIAIGFSDSTGGRKVLVLNEKGDMQNNETTYYYKDEIVLIKAAFDTIEKLPIIITYNGDSFDLPYLFARALKLNMKESNIPFTVKRKVVSKNAYVDPVYIKNAVHLDLYRFFKNKSIQNYAFSHKYNEFSLDAVCKGILNESKLDFDFVKDKDDLQKMADYCLNDADLTLKLTTFNDNLLIKLMLMLSRLSKLPLDDVCRYGVNQYSRALFYSEMIKKKMLIPRADEILVKGISASQEAIIKEKKFKGAFVAEPKKGVHFDVNVLDYSSLYPSIIKAYNISFETVNCVHDCCKKNKIPETENWTCKRVEGITSLIIGSLRDLRVNYYKYMTKKEGLTSDEQQLYDIVSQTLKVFLNGSYGVLGFEQFPLYCLPAAEAVTAYGRNIITRTIKHAEQNGISVVYGDSIMPDMPITIRKNNNISIIPIKSLIPDSWSTTRYTLKGNEILTDEGFKSIDYIYRHYVKKKIYKILTRKGYIECTEDHSLIIDGKETKPSDLKIGDNIDLIDFKIPEKYRFNNDVAWLFGLFIAEGTCGKYDYENGVKYTWRIVNQDIKLLEKCKLILKNNLGFDSVIRDHIKSSSVYALDIIGSTKLVYEYFSSLCYSKDEKVVPSVILEGDKETRLSFIDGLFEGDGYGDLELIDQKHKCVVAGIIDLLNSFEYSLNIRKDKPNIIRTRFIKDITDKRIKIFNKIKKIEVFDYDGYVYDISTQNGHFCGGIGNVLLHNTDSMFATNANEEDFKPKIDNIIKYTNDEFKIDLEVDKHYRFLILTELKKNYLGILDNSKLDIKGLTGKKAHTPIFIQNLFYEILSILSKVNNENELDPARDEITKLLKNRIDDLRNGKINLNELSFTPVISKDIDSYGKKLEGRIESPIDGKDKVEDYLGVPQHIKAAKMMENVGAGSKIKFIKTRNKEGVKPTDQVKSIGEVDIDKYIEIMDKVFSQVLSALKLEFMEIVNNVKQTKLDDIFWST